MTVEDCPRCGKRSLRIVNVMSTTRTIHYACSNCCFKEKRPYPEDVQGKQVRQMTLFPASKGK